MPAASLNPKAVIAMRITVSNISGGASTAWAGRGGPRFGPRNWLCSLLHKGGASI
jgi:hypothetical protein